MESQFDTEALAPSEQPVWKQMMASIFEQNKRMLEKNREHMLFTTKMEMEIQANRDELRYLKVVKDTQSDVVIANLEPTSIAAPKPTENVMRHPRRTRPWSEHYCDWCDLDDHNDSRCWFKHPEQAPKWWPEKYKDQIERYCLKNQGNNSDNEQGLIGNRPELAQSTTAFEATKDKVTNWQPAEITVEPTKCQIINYEPAEITKAITDKPAEFTLNMPAEIPHELAQIEVVTNEPTQTANEPSIFIMPSETIKELVVNEAISNEPAIVNGPAEETSNELTVTATTNEQVENTINEPEV